MVTWNQIKAPKYDNKSFFVTDTTSQNRFFLNGEEFFEDGGTMFNSLKVKKTDLLKKLRENKKKHREIFLDAQNGYRKKVIEILDERLKEARDGKKISHIIQLTSPEDHTSDYDDAIAMLEMSVDKEITLNNQEFRSLVLDKWGWERQFLTNNSSYSGLAMQRLSESSDEND